MKLSARDAVPEWDSEEVQLSTEEVVVFTETVTDCWLAAGIFRTYTREVSCQRSPTFGKSWTSAYAGCLI